VLNRCGNGEKVRNKLVCFHITATGLSMGVLTHVLVAQNGIRLGAKARSAVELILTKRGNKDEHVGKRHRLPASHSANLSSTYRVYEWQEQRPAQERRNCLH
jgi:hypothetical protein